MKSAIITTPEPILDHPALETEREFAALWTSWPQERHRLVEQERIASTLNSGGFACVSENSIALVRTLAWDSAHFGFPCADLVRVYQTEAVTSNEIDDLTERLLAHAREQKKRLLSARISASHYETLYALTRRGFRLVDTSVEFGAALSETTPIVAENNPTPEKSVTPIRIVEGEPHQLSALQSIATSFRKNRFFRDPQISTAHAEDVYRSWVSSALRNNLEGISVALVEDIPAGILVHKRIPVYHGAEAYLGIIGLGAIDPRYRGMGLFRRLLATVIDGFRTKSPTCEAVFTSTQVDNNAAMVAFHRRGLAPIQSRYILHGWL